MIQIRSAGVNPGNAFGSPEALKDVFDVLVRIHVDISIAITLTLCVGERQCQDHRHRGALWSIRGDPRQGWRWQAIHN